MHSIFGNPARLAASLRGAALGAAVLMLPGVTGTADAGPAVCRQIERQLASAQREPHVSRTYGRAIRAQELELAKATAQLAHADCTGFLSALRPQCSSLRSTVARMERNLASLRENRADATAKAGEGERAKLLAAYSESGCADANDELRTSALPVQKRERSGLPDSLFGPARPDDAAEGDGAVAQTAARQPYRALCVRTCDGYFFPLAYSTSQQNFTGDQQACEAACPGTEVELYYDQVPDEDGAKMVSGRTGAPYTQLPAAFLYKQAGYQRPAACGCNPHKDFSIIAGRTPEPEEDAAVAGAAAAASTVLAAEKPAAAAPAAVAAEEASPSHERTASVEAEPAPARHVRVVGPKFLPDPEEAIDLRAPARN
jgi:hypothetical protein